jgi:hypothetical protein
LGDGRGLRAGVLVIAIIHNPETAPHMHQAKMSDDFSNRPEQAQGGTI